MEKWKMFQTTNRYIHIYYIYLYHVLPCSEGGTCHSTGNLPLYRDAHLAMRACHQGHAPAAFATGLGCKLRLGPCPVHPARMVCHRTQTTPATPALARSTPRCSQTLLCQLTSMCTASALCPSARGSQPPTSRRWSCLRDSGAWKRPRTPQRSQLQFWTPHPWAAASIYIYIFIGSLNSKHIVKKTYIYIYISWYVYLDPPLTHRKQYTCAP